MSSLTTPTRLGRGLMVPDINTKHPVDNTSSALSYGGLHTPPQSAHESRRPSLQYSPLSEVPYSATSTSFHCSQPSTPIRSLHNGNNDFVSRWPDSAAAHHSSMMALQSTCPSNLVADHSLQDAFESQPVYSTPVVNALPSYAHLSHSGHDENCGLHGNSLLPSTEAWRPPHELVSAFGTNNTCLGSALFPISQGLSDVASGSMSSFDHPSASLPHPHADFEASSIGDLPGYSMAASFQQQPQVVVPSQLSPQDNYYQEHIEQYTSPVRQYDGVSSSFASASTDFNDYELVRPTSPMDAYFVHSEDEEYLMVKAEELDSPITGPSSRRLPEQHGMPMRAKRRSPRRLRKAGKSAPCHVHDVRGCLVQCEGSQCYLQAYKVEPATTKKPHPCTYPGCNAKFDRSEHLKRHLGKHQPQGDRKYPCPLCDRKIGRPDNAGDHFKTHLRPHKSGKRNPHFEWEVLRDAIWDSYEDQKVAKKLIDGLHRWIASGMPETSGTRPRRSS